MPSAVPDFSLACDRAPGAVVVHVHGALDRHSAPKLMDRLVELVDGEGDREVVVDLCRTTLIDFGGFLVLVEAQKWMLAHGGEIVLSGPTRSVGVALRAAGLDEVFEITPAWDHPARVRRNTRG